MRAFWRTSPRGGGPSPALQRQLLLELLEEALWLERGTDWALAECGGPTPATGVVGRRAGALIVDYHRLLDRLDRVAFDGEVAPLAVELGTLLHLRQALLRAGLQLAFSLNPTAGSERVRAGFNGLAAQGTRLRELHERVVGPAA
jgi:hypothetical protein